jgi:hypothetical protein
MTNMLLQDFADQAIGSQQYLTPGGPGWSTYVSAFTSVAVLAAIVVATVVALRSLRSRERAIKGTVATHAGSLGRRRETDDKAEWLRRTQWAMEAVASTNDRMYSYGAVIVEALARSDLTGPEDKAILDAVWEGSYTKMRDNEIRHLIAECRAVIEREKDEAALPNSVQRAADREDERQDLPASGESEATRRSVAGNATRADPATKDQVFATLRREILAARLKVTLDEQLGRETSRTVMRLAGMKLPPIMSSADR